MECNEVFSVARSTILGQTHQQPSQGDPENIFWNGPPVGSLSSGSAGTSDGPVDLCGAAVLKMSDVSGTKDTESESCSISADERHSDSDQLIPISRNWLELCHCRQDLFAIKLFYFAFLGSLGVVLPYVAVFLKQLGLSPLQIGVISGVRPVLGFVSAPAWGAAADRYGIRRILMLISMLAWLAFFVALYNIHEPTRRGYCPESMWSVTRQKQFRSKRQGELESTNTSQSSTERISATTESSVVSQQQYISLANTTDSGNNLLTTYSPLFNASNVALADRVGVDEDVLELLREDLQWLYEPDDAYRVFIVCLIIICGGELFQAPTTAMSDAATLQILGRDGLHKYGAQRAWGPVGWASSSLLIGVLLDAYREIEVVCSIRLTFNDYRIVSVVFFAFFVIGFFSALKINFATEGSQESKTGSNSDDDSSKPTGQQQDGGKSDDVTQQKQQPEMKHDTLSIIRVFVNVRNGSWLLTTFFVGVSNGAIWGFLFWHIDNLGASRVMMGVSTVVVCLSEFVAFFFVDDVIKKIGHMGVMYIGLAGYAVRFVVYAAATNPWAILPVEILQGVTFSFIWVSLSQYTAVAVPTVSLATVQGIIHGVYFGLGNGVGHLVAGVTIGRYGAVVTFYALAVANVVWLAFFAVCQKLSKKPRDPFSYQDMNDEVGDNTTKTD